MDERRRGVGVVLQCMAGLRPLAAGECVPRAAACLNLSGNLSGTGPGLAERTGRPVF